MRSLRRMEAGERGQWRVESGWENWAVCRGGMEEKREVRREMRWEVGGAMAGGVEVGAD